MITKRNDIREVRAVLSFLRAAEKRAREKGALATAFALRDALRAPDIQRLETLPPLGAAHPTFSSITQFSLKKGVAFPLETLFTELSSLTKNNQPEYDNLSRIGQVLRTFEEVKAKVSTQTPSTIDLSSQMASTLSDLTTDPSVLPDEFALDHFDLEKDIRALSFQIKPKEFRIFSIGEFKSLSQLREYLSYIYSRDEDYHMSDASPVESIVQFVKDKVSQDNDLDYFQDAIEILTYVEKIEQSQKRTYKGNIPLEFVLETYEKRIALLLKENFKENVPKLEAFFHYFLNNTFIKEKGEAESSQSSFFAPSPHLVKIIKKLNRFHEHYVNESQNIKNQLSILTYTQLLDEILEGKAHSSIISIESDTPNQEDEEDNELVPSTEFPIIEEEIGPRFIGINRTMTFNPKESRNVLDLFRTKELIRDFMRFFPWSINIISVDRLNDAEYNPDLNLIGTKQVFSTKVQLATLRFLLTSLDALGKVVGQDGELAIENFTVIKEITDNLHSLQKLLESVPSPTEEEETLTKINLMLDSAQRLDEKLYGSSTVHTYDNTQLNIFCYLNVYLSYLLTNQPFDKSGLTPPEPPPPIQEMINKTMARMKK